MEPTSNCFLFFHDYKKWEDKESFEITSYGSVIGRGMYQERRCNRCNRLQIRVIKIKSILD